MQHYTLEQYKNDRQLHNTLDRNKELVDGRFAVVNQVCYEIVEFKNCPNGKSYAVLWVRSAQNCYGPETLVGNTDVRMELTDVYVSENLAEIHMQFIKFMMMGLNKY